VKGRPIKALLKNKSATSLMTLNLSSKSKKNGHSHSTIVPKNWTILHQ
jgi:hypothetical protein